MKKLILIVASIVLLLTVGIANADIVFYNGNTPTVGWEAVTTDIDGDPITGVKYRLYLANADTDLDKANPVIVADNIIGLAATITLGTKGRYFVGVQSFVDELISDINWGDEIINQENVVLFGLRWAVSPHPPKDMRK